MDYEEEEKMQYQGSGAIPALAEEEMGEDDEYDDLYNDVNVGENFLQMHGSEAPAPSATAGNGGFQTRNAHESRVETGGSQALAITRGSQVLAVTGGGLAVEGMYSNAKAHFPEQKQVAVGVEVQDVGPVDGSSVAQKGRVIEMSNDVQVRNMGFQKSTPVPPGIGVDPSDMSRKIANEPDPLPISGSTGPRGPPQIQLNQMHVSADVNRPVVNENQVRPPVENGATTLYVGELHWWTTDAELESFASQYGRVKEIKFFDERASGKSKGYCQVDFYEAAAAAACKEGMNGHVFNGRPCVVAFASPQTLKQMGASYMNKNQGQSQPQSQSQGRGSMNDGAGRGGNANFQSGDGGRNYGRGGWGRGGQGILNRGPGGGPMRGRGGMGPKNMAGNVAGVGSGANGGGYGQGIAGPAFGGPAGGMMPHQAMMGAGFDPLYMGRGGGYGGFAGPGFPGMMPSFPGVNSMGLAGVAPHVNPAFFARGMAPNGMGMMASSGMEGPNPGKWADMSMGGWGEEPGRRTRESSYDGDEGASEYGYGEGNHEKGGARSSGASREKERVSERDWSGNSDRRHRDEREQDWDRPEREHKYKEEKDSYRGHRQRERDSGYEDDRDRGHSSSRVRSRSRAAPEEDYRSRSRDVDYGKRRRLPSE